MTHLIHIYKTDPNEFQTVINQQIKTVQDDGFKIVDIKYSVGIGCGCGCGQASFGALILYS